MTYKERKKKLQECRPPPLQLFILYSMQITIFFFFAFEKKEKEKPTHNPSALC